MKTIDEVLKHGNNRVKPLDTDIEAIQEAKQDLLDIILECVAENTDKSIGKNPYLRDFNKGAKWCSAKTKDNIRKAFDE